VIHILRSTHVAATAILLLFVAIGAQGQFFETSSSLAIAGEPWAVAVGDFNRDGKLDIATTDFFHGQVAVYLGNGDGTFQPPVYYAIDSHLESLAWIATADFRGDGKLDLAVADYHGRNISILLGNGDGTFQPPVQYHVPSSPSFVAVGDFNSDGKPDLLFSDAHANVMLGNGDGTFQPPKVNGTTLAFSYALALGDFDHDGNLDVVVIKHVNPGSGVAILLGNGDGTFHPSAEYAVNGAAQVAVGDFNGDHNLDLAVSQSDFVNQIQIMLGNGDGTFRFGAIYEFNGPSVITTADMNDDGELDLLFLNALFRKSVDVAVFTVMLGNGDGTFQAPVNYPRLPIGTNIAVGDFNGDHKLDVALGGYVGGTLLGGGVDVLLNSGVVSLFPPTPISFNAQFIGSGSPQQNITLTNTGTTTLLISSMSTNKPFQLGPTSCGRTVAAGGKCILSAIFEPAVLGFQTGTLVLNDTASSKPQVIELSGTGTTLTVSSSQLNFGSQKVFSRSKPQSVTITNTGSTALSITGVVFTGIGEPYYEQINDCGTQIDPGASCRLSIVFTPRSTGSEPALAMINGPNGAVWQQVQLTGTGI